MQEKKNQEKNWNIKIYMNSYSTLTIQIRIVSDWIVNMIKCHTMYEFKREI